MGARQRITTQPVSTATRKKKTGTSARSGSIQSTNWNKRALSDCNSRCPTNCNSLHSERTSLESNSSACRGSSSSRNCIRASTSQIQRPNRIVKTMASAPDVIPSVETDSAPAPAPAAPHYAPYKAFYSTITGEFVRDYSLMHIPIDDHMAHRYAVE